MMKILKKLLRPTPSVQTDLGAGDSTPAEQPKTITDVSSKQPPSLQSAAFPRKQTWPFKRGPLPTIDRDVDSGRWIGFGIGFSIALICALVIFGLSVRWPGPASQSVLVAGQKPAKGAPLEKTKKIESSKGDVGQPVSEKKEQVVEDRAEVLREIEDFALLKIAKAAVESELTSDADAQSKLESPVVESGMPPPPVRRPAEAARKDRQRRRLAIARRKANARVSKARRNSRARYSSGRMGLGLPGATRKRRPVPIARPWRTTR